MRVTIVKPDNYVAVDGHVLAVDCSSLPEDVHAIVWEGDRGFIQFVSAGPTNTKPNEPLKSFAPYRAFVRDWAEARARKAVSRVDEIEAQIATAEREVVRAQGIVDELRASRLQCREDARCCSQAVPEIEAALP